MQQLRHLPSPPMVHTPVQNNASTDHVYRPYILSKRGLPAAFFSRLSHVRLTEQILFELVYTGCSVSLSFKSSLLRFTHVTTVQ